MARETIRRYIDIDKEDAEWFDSQYPRGSMVGIVTLLLRKFREAHDRTPQDYARIAAEALAEDMKRAR